MVANTFLKCKHPFKFYKGKAKKQTCNNFRSYKAKSPVKGSDKNINRKIKSARLLSCNKHDDRMILMS